MRKTTPATERFWKYVRRTESCWEWTDMTDMWNKGRASARPGFPGELHPMAKLTREQVDEIRRLRREGMAGPAIGARFGVTKTTVYRIASGRQWKTEKYP